MFALLTPPNGGLPSIVSQLSHDYPTMIQAGYVTLMEGTKKDLLPFHDNLIEDFACELEILNQNKE